MLPEGLRDGADRIEVHARDATGLTPAHRALLDRIEAAPDARERLHLDYADAEGAISARWVRPLGLWFWGKVWTLVGWCELRQDFRMFRVDRIQAMTSGARFHDERGKSLADFYARMRAEGYHR